MTVFLSVFCVCVSCDVKRVCFRCKLAVSHDALTKLLKKKRKKKKTIRRRSFVMNLTRGLFCTTH